MIMTDYIKSPLNYIGGKYKILPQILPLFPNKISRFVDLFAGGANVGINNTANVIILNDNLVYLIDLYKILAEKSATEIFKYIEKVIKKFNLSLTNTDGYNNLRKRYNKNRNPMDLLILSFFSFNHQIRFNSDHKFNTPFGKNRSHYNENIKRNLFNFIKVLKNKKIVFSKKDFDKFDLSKLTKNDFVYCDPPYLITVGTYNDGRRGFTGWNLEQEQKLLDILYNLDKRKIKFALSNVLTHKDKKNVLLHDWIKKNNYKVHHIARDYTNSNYHTNNRNKKTTKEVLITNY